MKPIGWIAIVASLILVFSCTPYQADDLNHAKSSAALDLGPDPKPAVGAFLIIIDASGSMSEKFQGQLKLTLAKQTAINLINTLPDPNLLGGMRTMGNALITFGSRTDLVWGLADRYRREMTGAIQAVRFAGGQTPLSHAIGGVREDMGGYAGKMAVIVISDGVEKYPEETIQAAETLVGRFEKRISINTVLVGDDPAARELMSEVAEASGCGLATTALALADSVKLADFIKDVFYGTCP